MITKHKYTNEFEIHASPKNIYMYLHQANGLQEWFAKEVHTDKNKTFQFIWDHTSYFARIAAFRKDKQIKFEFLDENKQSIENPSYIEFRLLQSELTHATYLKITDYSEMMDETELDDLWRGLVLNLREIIGG